MITRKETLELCEQTDADMGLETMDLNTLQGLCQRLGQSGRGTKQECIKRIRYQIRKG